RHMKGEIRASPPAQPGGAAPLRVASRPMTASVGAKVEGAEIDEGDLPSVYLYWELTDEGIADARARLGDRGAFGWVDLRIYDTTGHDFDGTNANDYFDLRVDRADREYYLMIRRPGSSLHAEIG